LSRSPFFAQKKKKNTAFQWRTLGESPCRGQRRNEAVNGNAFFKHQEKKEKKLLTDTFLFEKFVLINEGIISPQKIKLNEANWMFISSKRRFVLSVKSLHFSSVICLIP
jgi:hypothetical protein